MKLVIYPAVDAERLCAIEEAAEVEVINAPSLEDTLESISNADCFFGKMTPEILERARNLKWIQSPTASLEHYLFPALVEHPSVLTNMRGLFSDVIADQVLGYIICFARNLHTYIRNQTQAKWAPVGGEESRSSFQTGPGQLSSIDIEHRQLAGQTVGIVGCGEIGLEVACRAAAFRLRVIGVDALPKQSPPEMEWIAGLDRLGDLLSQSDYVVVAAPHTPDSVGMFGPAQFKAMRDDAILINVGRGALIQLDPLVESLRRKEIGGAALDVFEVEPLPTTHPLWSLPNVILTPHIAGYAPCIPERHLKLFLDNLKRFVAGQPLQQIVDKRRWF